MADISQFTPKHEPEGQSSNWMDDFFQREVPQPPKREVEEELQDNEISEPVITDPEVSEDLEIVSEPEQAEDTDSSEEISHVTDEDTDVSGESHESEPIVAESSDIESVIGHDQSVVAEIEEVSSEDVESVITSDEQLDSSHDDNSSWTQQGEVEDESRSDETTADSDDTENASRSESVVDAAEETSEPVIVESGDASEFESDDADASKVKDDEQSSEQLSASVFESESPVESTEVEDDEHEDDVTEPRKSPVRTTAEPAKERVKVVFGKSADVSTIKNFPKSIIVAIRRVLAEGYYYGRLGTRLTQDEKSLLTKYTGDDYYADKHSADTVLRKWAEAKSEEIAQNRLLIAFCAVHAQMEIVNIEELDSETSEVISFFREVDPLESRLDIMQTMLGNLNDSMRKQSRIVDSLDQTLDATFVTTSFLLAERLGQIGHNDYKIKGFSPFVPSVVTLSSNIIDAVNKEAADRSYQERRPLS